MHWPILLHLKLNTISIRSLWMIKTNISFINESSLTRWGYMHFYHLCSFPLPPPKLLGIFLFHLLRILSPYIMITLGKCIMSWYWVQMIKTYLNYTRRHLLGDFIMIQFFVINVPFMHFILFLHFYIINIKIFCTIYEVPTLWQI